MEIGAKPTGIIVADDDALIRSIVRANFEALNLEVFQAVNGLEAVQLASRVNASLVLLDIRMPKLDGVHACEQIRKLPGYAHTPIAMLTFDDREPSQRASSRAGATMFLVKPFSSAALMLALSPYLPISIAARDAIRETAFRAAGGRALARMRT